MGTLGRGAGNSCASVMVDDRFDRVSDLIEIIVDLETGKILGVNDTACLLFGYARAELLAMSASEITGESPSALRATFLDLRTAKVMHWEGNHRRRDGTAMPVEVSLVLMEHERAVAIVRDVSHRNRVEVQLSRLTAALEQAADSILITDIQGRIEYVNGSFERLTGYLRSEVVGKNPRFLNSGEQDHRFYQAMWADLARGETWSARMINRRKDGTFYHQQTTISAVRDRDGTIVSYIGVGRDITREIELEAKLEQALRHTQTLLDASPVGILSYKATGESTGANPAAAAIVGGTIEELEAQNFHQIASWRTSRLYETATKALATGREQRVETKLSTSFGREVWLGVRCVPFEFDGEPHLMVTIGDLTEHKALEAQFLQAQKMEAIGRLAGGVAHDFNNILAVIISFSDFIREATPRDDDRHADILEVLTAAERAASLTRQLLIFSRQQPSEKHPTDLNESLTQISRFLARTVGDDVRVSVTPAANPVVVSIDPVQFDQIILNLAVNARDAMPMGGSIRIEISSDATSGRARLTVSDTGIGMTAETQLHIFEPFFTTKAQGKGTGLGLATCFGIISEAGGTIRVASSPGKGTTFTIELPLAADEVAAIPTPEILEYRGHGEVVLVAEDEDALRRATVRTLELAGYSVFAAAGGDAAIRKIDELGTDLRLVVSDIVMPGRNGHDVALHLSTVAPRTPIILTSGYVNAEMESATGGESILWKPVRPADLLRAVASSISRAGPPDTAHEPEVASRSAARERVLVVEDEPSLGAACQRCLERDGFDVVVATTLADARAALEREEPDVLVADLGLPDGSGLDLVHELRARRSEIPALIVTGSTSISMASSAVHLRVSEYLQKPVSAAELRRAVRAAAEAGRVARLRSKLLAARFGNEELLRDFAVMETNFASALSTLRMVYQPIVRASDLTVVAHEALVRNDEPALASAAALVSAAEALGRIDELGRAVRTHVARTLETRQGCTEMTFVNVHPMEFRLDTIADPTDPLTRFASQIVLEVTECASLDPGPSLDTALAQFRKLGYRIALDDLGEGYASLSSLLHLRPEFAKIDMSLVRGVHDSSLKRDVIASVVDLAARTGITTIAEGVETTEERDALRALGCDWLQGYLFGRPAPYQ